MVNIQLETFLGTVSFVILFLSMILYWVQSIFLIIPKFHLIIFLTTLSANLSLLFLLILRWFNYNHFPLSNLYESLLFLSWSFTLIQLFLGPSILKPNASLNKNNNKINLTTKPLMINKFQSILGSFFATPLVPVRGEYSKDFARIKNPSNNDIKKRYTNINTIIGTIISPIALFTNSFATFSLPKTMQKAQALVPALQSNWLMMHVTVMMLSYTALLCGSLLAITFLIVTRYQPKSDTLSASVSEAGVQPVGQESLRTGQYLSDSSEQVRRNCEPVSQEISINYLSLQDQSKQQKGKQDENFYNSLFTNSKMQSSPIQSTKAKLLTQPVVSLPIHTLSKTLDNLSYRILGIGFPLLTIGILSGAVWANEAWGSYWSWDPKETWAFITWLVFAIYLHARIVKGWEGEKPAILASFGFFVVWICYLGVNLLGTGLHSYGWMQ